MVMDEQTFLL